MRSRVPTGYFLIPLVYLAIIGFFIHLHLNDGEQTINQQVGPLQVEAELSGGVNKKFDRITVSFFGFSLDLSEGIPVEGSGGTRRLIPITSVEPLENSIRIGGEEGASLLFSLGHSLGAGVFEYPAAYPRGDEKQGIRMDWSPPEKEAKAAAQLSFLSSYEIEQISPTLPVFSAVGEASSYICTATGSPSVDETGILDIPLRGHEEEEAESGYIIVPYEGDDPLHYWYFGSSQPKERETYTELYESWRDAAYVGWESRYQPNESSWRGGDGGMSEFEAIMTAYASETMRREQNTGLEIFSEAMDAFGGRHSFFSSPYLGNIIGNNEELIEQEQQRARQVQTFIDNQDPALFSEQSDFLRFLIWHGEEALIEDFDAYIAALDLAAISDPAALIELFSFAVKASEIYEDLFPHTAERLEDIYRKVRTSMVRIGESTLYPTSEKGVDTEKALTLARTLMGYSSMREDQFAETLGAEIGVFVLGHMNEEGFLPESFRISGENMTAEQSQRAPETIYPIVNSNKYYPRLVSLRDELDMNVRLWTVAQGVGASRSGNGMAITFDFAVGETEYVTARGIPSFENFSLYNLRWNSDRRFQTYGVGGWFYDDQLQTLYVKFRHQSKVERIEMTGL